MNLKDILTRLVETDEAVLLNDGARDWEAGTLLQELSVPMLKRSAYLQPGMYIAEINSGGYLGQVLYKVKRKA
jgi:hypothetical protein